ncbi:MAG: NAD(P)H-hydrate dehydratase [Bdellovibrionales bacterium]|nr:NAD(P)H-hydrate dehydratase [Bdellovibrionales bacterium]
MKALLTAAQSRAADRYTIDSLHQPSRKLMEAAAEAVYQSLRAQTPDPKTPGAIVAGPGNNGGDAFALARILKREGYSQFHLYLIGGASMSPDAAEQRSLWEKDGGEVRELPAFERAVFEGVRWIVDGLLGTGLSRPVEGEWASWIDGINALHVPHVFAIDIPSGLNADTGAVMGRAIRATHTVTFGSLKRGLVTGDAGDCVGKLSCRSIGIVPGMPGEKLDCFLFGKSDAEQALPMRSASGHKGSYGHVYLWVGTEATEGAAGLAAIAAYRAGSGLVSLVADHSLASLRSRLPVELMAKEIGSDFFSALQRSDTLVIGPGLGTAKGTWKKIQEAMQSPARLVLDADALNVIAANAPEACELLSSRKISTVCTPHPKEAARLLGLDVAAVNRDRYQAVRALADRYHALFVLKGWGTLLSRPQGPTWVVQRGNSALSKGGTGDLLSGILGALVGQGEDTLSLSALAVYAHGRSAELWSEEKGTERSALASEFANKLTAVWAELERKTS